MPRFLDCLQTTITLGLLAALAYLAWFGLSEQAATLATMVPP